jgi:hypothetical protein
MLTPVRAASNTSLSSNGQSVAIVASGLARSIVAPAPVQAVEGSDLNSAIAGKLNLLLAAARERMFDALLDAINAASEALPLPRQDGETNLAFAARLADTIQKLPAARINEIETQLAADGHTLPLRLIAEALKNPAGPEAARVVAYLETIRYKDRDLAARAVVRSYRQNDASPLRPEQRPDIVLQEDSILPQPKGDTVPARETQAQAPARQTAEPAAQLPLAALSSLPVETIEEIAAEPEMAGEMLQVETADEVIEAKEPAAEVPQQLAEAETHQTAPMVVKDRAEPVIPKIWPAVLASITEEASELLVAIIGEQEVATLLDALAAETDDPEAMPEQAISDEMKEAVDGPEQAATQKQTQPADAAAARAVAADAAQIARQQKEIAAQPQVLPSDLTEMAQKSGLLRPADGVGYMATPYHFAKDGAERRDPQMHRSDYEGGAGDDEQEAQSGDEQQSAGQQEQQRPQGRVPADLPEIEARPEEPRVADPVFALYQRMVGWE